MGRANRIRYAAGLFAIVAPIAAFFHAQNQIGDNPIASEVIYLQALVRIATIGAIALGAYIVTRTMYWAHPIELFGAIDGPTPDRLSEI